VRESSSDGWPPKQRASMCPWTFIWAPQGRGSARALVEERPQRAPRQPPLRHSRYALGLSEDSRGQDHPRVLSRPSAALPCSPSYPPPLTRGGPTNGVGHPRFAVNCTLWADPGLRVTISLLRAFGTDACSVMTRISACRSREPETALQSNPRAMRTESLFVHCSDPPGVHSSSRRPLKEGVPRSHRVPA
jgi:hypothetical protein